MTVRTWFTISALVLVALGVAVAVRVLSPLPAPDVLATVSGIPLRGYSRGSCWPQRSGELRCAPAEPIGAPGTPVRGDGRLRIVADFPVQPQDGRLLIVRRRGGATVTERVLAGRIDLDLDGGGYRLEVEARWRGGAFVRRAFPFDVRED